MSGGDAGTVICPRCSAENSRGSTLCFLCDASLAGAAPFIPPKPGAVGVPALNRPTFRLNSMMLLIALLAVFLGLWHESGESAMLVIVPGSIALIRTFVAAGRRGRPSSILDHVVVFIGTFVAVVVVVVAAGIAFFATCLAVVSAGQGRSPTDGVQAGLVCGGIAGVATIIGLTAAFIRWSRRNRDSAGTRSLP